MEEAHKICGWDKLRILDNYEAITFTQVSSLFTFYFFHIQTLEFLLYRFYINTTGNAIEK